MSAVIVPALEIRVLDERIRDVGTVDRSIWVSEQLSPTDRHGFHLPKGLLRPLICRMPELPEVRVGLVVSHCLSPDRLKQGLAEQAYQRSEISRNPYQLISTEPISRFLNFHSGVVGA